MKEEISQGTTKMRNMIEGTEKGHQVSRHLQELEKMIRGD